MIRKNRATADESEVARVEVRSETPMKRRKLGTLEVSEMGFGCMSISANYGPAPDKIKALG
jgi:hypothetical protein